MTSPYSARFRCIAGCDGDHPLDQPLYRCPRCGDLLEVVHDVEALQKRSAADWKTLFGERYRSPEHPWSSGVWGKREVVAPHVRDEHIVSLGEGASPLVPAPRYGRAIGAEDLWIKQCGTSHSGSFKDLGMTVLVSTVAQMIADGRGIPAIACASTGDTSAALAAYAAAAGIRAAVLLPRGKITTAQLVQPLANGALVLALDTDFDGCMRLVAELADRDGVYLANSMNSLRLEGQKTVAMEIAQQLGWQVPDWVVIPGGNLGNVSAMAAGFALLEKLGLVSGRPRLCVAQAEHANPLYESFLKGFESFESMTARPTLASAIQIGAPVSRDKAIRALRAHDGVVEQASERELADAAALADRGGFFACPHTGVALAAAAKLAARGDIRPEHRVVVVSTASGLKFTDFKVGYHEGSLEAVTEPGHANRPLDLAADYGAVRDTVLRFLEAGD